MGTLVCGLNWTRMWMRKGSDIMVRRKMLVLTILGLTVTLGVFGCGANPGGEFIDGDVGDIGLPVNGVTQRVQQAYQYLAAGSYNAARATFNEALADRPTAQQKSQALVGVGFCDARTLGTSEGMAEFTDAYAEDHSNPDARVGYAGALITRGSQADIALAVQLLEGLDPSNVNFVYTDRFGLGISNAEVHALLAYAYKANGDTLKSAQQADIARTLDASLSNTAVDQILDVLSFIP